MLSLLAATCLSGASAPGAAALVGEPAPLLPVQVAPLPLATSDDALDVTGQPVAAREEHDRLTVGVQVNGSGPYQFMVDTGADASVLGQHLASLLELPAHGCVRLHGSAGTTLVPTVHVDSLRVGSHLVEHLTVPVLRENTLDADGVIGIDALVSQRIKLDFESRTITMEDAGRREVTPAGEAGDVVVTARRQRGQLILAAASSSGVRMLAVIDTGANVTVGNSALRARLFGLRDRLQSEPVTLVSVTGQTVVADLVIVPQLDIGSLRLRSLPIAFTDVPPFALFGLTDEPSVLLGTDVLRAFKRITLDFRRHKVRFSLRSAGTETQLDAATRALVTNPALLALDQEARIPRPIHPASGVPAGVRLWTSALIGRAVDTVAEFNASDTELNFDMPWTR